MGKERSFTPEAESFVPGRTLIHCNKSENHHGYKSPQTLCPEDLPCNWQNLGLPSSGTLKYLKIASRRVVHLTVLKQSSSRFLGGPQNGPCYGSGYLTFHPVHGAIVHTSKHVVYDPFEADRTIVRLFYDDENTSELELFITSFILENLRKINGDVIHKKNSSSIQILHQIPNTTGLLMSFGNCNHFQSVMASDYTSFSCDLPIHELFSEEEIDKLSGCFSWFNFNVRKFLLSPPKEIDIAIISHPHGGPKVLSFGRMNRLCSVTPSLYDAPTCQGSSGAPLIRLKSDSGHINVGQFLHHGHQKGVLNKGMGTVRPPWAFPYFKCLDTESTLSNAVDILYEPLFYWTLFFCDLLQLESTLTNIVDVFAYTSSISALLFTVECTLFKILLTCYFLHLVSFLVINSYRAGLKFAVSTVGSTMISMSMFPVAWLILYLCPWEVIREIIAIIVWTIILYFERYFQLAGKFQRKLTGSFSNYARIKLKYELGVHENAHT